LFIYIVLLEINNYKAINKQYKSEAEKEFHVISKTLEFTFEYTNYINSTIGKQIALHPDDLEFIHKLLSNPKHGDYNKLLYFSWSLFDWVDNKNLQQVNSQIGIRSPAPDMSKREYIDLSYTNPWTLQFAKPTIGDPSTKYVIPAGTGITDAHGQYLGVVVVGFVIDDLINQVKQFTNSSSLGFALEGNDGIQYLKYEDNIEYIAQGYLQNYPFTLKVGFKQGTIQKAFLKILIYDMLKIAFGMVLLGVLLMMIRKTLKRKELMNDKQNISRASLAELSKTQLNSMKEQINKTIKRVNENMTEIEKDDKFTDTEKQEMYSMLVVLHNIKDIMFSSSKLHLKSVNIDNIIQSALKLKAVEILEANLQVNIEVHINETIQLDEVKIIQLFNFIISYIISTGGKSLVLVLKKINGNIRILFSSQNITDDQLMHYIQQDGINYTDIRNIVYYHKADIECKTGEIILTIPSL
jgi:hypothetical protein